MNSNPAQSSAAGRLLNISAVVVGITLIKAVALCLVYYWPNTSWRGHAAADLWTWQSFYVQLQEGKVPLLDLNREYPYLAIVFYWLMSFGFSDFTKEFVNYHGWVILFVDIASTILFIGVLRNLKINNFLLPTLLFQCNLTALVLAPYRFDSLVMLFIVLGLYFSTLERPKLAIAAWATGFHVKWIPAAFIASETAHILFQKRKPWTAAACALIATLLVVAPIVVVSTVEYLLRGTTVNFLPLLYHIERPLSWDTVPGIVSLWCGPIAWDRWLPALSFGLMLLATFFPSRLALHGKIVLICCAALFFNRIYSPQFHLWFYPALSLLICTAKIELRRRMILLFLLLDLLNVVVFPFSFSWADDQLGGFSSGRAATSGGVWSYILSAAVFARTGVLIFLVGTILRGYQQNVEWQTSK